MNKNELIAHIVTKTATSKADAAAALDAVLEGGALGQLVWGQWER